MAKEEQKSGADIEVGAPAAPTVDWDDSEMQSTYANVVNASSTREEVMLFFGTNQTWNPQADRKFKVKLHDRMVLNPHAAKRLWILLGAILKEYENRFGVINMEGIGGSAAKTNGSTNGASKASKKKADDQPAAAQ
jgi:hypothetical protein